MCPTTTCWVIIRTTPNGKGGKGAWTSREGVARRFVGRRVRQKYNVARAEDGSETFDYYDGLVKDAGWSDDLQWYTLDILYDMDGDMEHGVHVADRIKPAASRRPLRACG